MDKSKIFITDNNEIDNIISEHMIKASGFKGEFIFENDTLAAIAHLKQLSGDPTKFPSLIITNLAKPHMSGFDFIAAISELEEIEQGKCLVAIVSSAAHRDGNPAYAAKFSCVKFVEQKPISTELGRRLIHHML
ncbi:MAG: hypothetical protein AAFY71_21290 [Bacteroidota bacterium]